MSIRLVPRGPIARTLLAVSLMLAARTRAPAQTATAPELKAALLLNFARFAEWPGIAPDAPVVLCVFGDDRVAGALGVVVQGRSVDGHAVRVSTVLLEEPLAPCHLLFISGSDSRRAAPVVEGARALPVLTVSDGEHFSKADGMIELFEDGGRMRFAINVDAVQRSRVRLSSRLLSLAKVVRD